jgi:hypothetical protein
MLLWLTTTACLVNAPSALAQPAVGVSAAGLGYLAHYRIQYQGATSELTGFWYGGEASARLGPFALELLGVTGTGSGSTSTANPERTVRETAATVRMAATDWLQLGLGLDAWHFENSGLATGWKLIGIDVVLTPSFGVAGLRGIVDARYFPSASISGGPSMSLAAQGRLGVEYAVPGSGVLLTVGYRFSRFDFSQAGAAPARLEQASGLLFGAGFRLGR